MKRKNYLEENLKKLIGKTEPIQTLDSETKNEILKTLTGRNVMETRSVFNFKTAAAIAAVILVVCAIFLFSKPKENTTTPIELVKPTPPTSTLPQDIVQPEIKTIDFDIAKLAAAGDIKGLIAALGSDNKETKLAAANLLADMGDANAIEALKKQAEQWTDTKTENPFVKAIAKLEKAQTKTEKTVDANKTSGGNIKKVNDPNILPFMEIYVTDKQTDQPIAGARVKSTTFITDANGYCKVTLGEHINQNYFSVYIEKEGFVPMSFCWGKQFERAIPKDFEFFLERGTVIGGVVVNEANQPVSDANVIISYYSQNADRNQPYSQINDYTIRTDADGKWQFDMAPADISYENQVSIKIKHPDYAEYQIWAHSQETTIQQLRDKTFASILKKGSIIHGYVLDSVNRPIPDADVFIGEDRYSDENLKTKTDNSGYYEFTRVKQGFNLLAVFAKGYAPDMKELELRENECQHNFTLLPGNTIRGHVVDVNGNPIANVSLNTDEWHGYRMINWQSKTDAEGRFVWTEAPADEVKFDFYVNNYMSTRNKVLTPSKNEYEIVLYPPLKISGTVTMADTNEPVKEFTITKGIRFENDQRIHWEQKNQNPESVKTFTDGKYKFEITHPYYRHILRVDTNDGKVAVSRLFDSNEGSVQYDFVIGKEETNRMAGTVYTPDGKEAQNATVYLVVKNQWLNLENGKDRYQQNCEKATTNAQGKFKLPDCNDIFKLVAVSEEGFADVNSSEFLSESVIRLAKWGRIEGVLYIGSKPAANCTVRASCQQKYNNRDDLNYNYSNNATTDKQGKFVMEKVVPSMNNVYRMLQSEEMQQSTSTATQIVEVVSGQTAEVVMGGTGRAIIGKIIWPTDELFTKSLWINANLQLEQTTDPMAMMEKIYGEAGDMPKPVNFDTLTAKQCIEWYTNWSKSEEGKVYQAKIMDAVQKIQPQLINQSIRHGGVIVNSDGSFRGEDVEEGSYSIRVTVCEKKGGRYGNADYQNQVIGTVNFAMPPVDKSNIDTPLDLGQLPFEIIEGKNKLRPDSNAPDFTIETNTGTVKLADLRGKYVVLVFWNGWITLSNPSFESTMLEMFAAYKKYAGNSNIEFIGISGKSMPMQKDISEKYLKENSCNWKQAYVGYDDAISKAYSYQYAISAMLIGPDGKVIESGIDGKKLSVLLESVK
jgi:hypothetical protein